VTGNHVISPLRPSDPQRLGTYRIVGRLGRGGMGTVYLAESESGERAAVKMINPELADDETFRDRFRREVESARRVRRFCTAPVLDARLDGEPLFIVTEFVDGPNLDEFVKASGPMRGSSLEHLAVGVATALTAIHGAGVIHRDLKPANVLLSSVGPRVIDFGIARALDTVSGATRTGQFIGTPAYMAPELISGGTAAPAADVFAWGCVVAFAGTGKAPFDGPTVPSVLYQVSHGEPSLDGLDDGLRDLVTRTLVKDPALRPSAQEVLDALTGRPHVDTAEAAATVGRTWALPSEGTTRPDTARTRALPPRPPDATRVRKPLVLGATGLAAVLVLGIGAFLLLRGSDGPPEAATSVYTDDFHDTDSGWSGSTWTSGSGYFQGGYRIDAGTPSAQESEKAPFTGNLPDKLLLSVDATVRNGPAYGQVGLYCRGNGDIGDAAVSYDFVVRADGRGVLIRKEAGKRGSKELATRSSAAGFRAGKPNRLQVACEQDGGKVRLRFWINGTLAVEASDTDRPLPNAGAGLMARLDNGGSGGHVQTFFDNFDMSSIG
jgi:serine/threonine protein kinase